MTILKQLEKMMFKDMKDYTLRNWDFLHDPSCVKNYKERNQHTKNISYILLKMNIKWLLKRQGDK